MHASANCIITTIEDYINTSPQNTDTLNWQEPYWYYSQTPRHQAPIRLCLTALPEVMGESPSLTMDLHDYVTRVSITLLSTHLAARSVMIQRQY